METYLQFILLILAIAIAFVGLILFLRHINKPIIKQVILGLVIKAEKYLGSGTGELKKATVVSWIYSKVPPGLRWMFTEKDLSNIIEWAVVVLKDSLKDESVNLSGYDDEVYLKSISNSKNKQN
jgi:hypothetical protein